MITDYQTEEFWKGYPHWEMKPTIKYYYLYGLLLPSSRIASRHTELTCLHLLSILTVCSSRTGSSR